MPDCHSEKNMSILNLFNYDLFQIRRQYDVNEFYTLMEMLTYFIAIVLDCFCIALRLFLDFN